MAGFELDPNVPLGHTGKLELLYNRALQRSKAALEAEALEALERSDSLEDSWQLSSQGTVEEVVEVLKEVQERKSLYRSRVSEHADREIEPEMEHLGAAHMEPPIDFFSHVNPDCFNVDGKPVAKPRWHPPGNCDARRRPHVPLDRDFDSPSESEESEEDDHVDQEARTMSQRSVLKRAAGPAKTGRQFEKVEVTQSFKAGAPEAGGKKMGQFQLQERPSEGQPQLALPAPAICPCHGPHCCIDHCRNLAGHCSTLLEGLRHWRQAKVVPKPQPPRGPYKLEDEDPAVEELRMARERQLTMGTLEQNRTRARQRAS